MWIGNFALRVHGTYETLAFDYSEASRKVYVATQGNSGHNVRIAFGRELAEAEALLSRSRFWRAWDEEWRHSYICGNRSCWSFVFGDRDGLTVVFYLLLLVAVWAMVRSIVTEGIYFIFSQQDLDDPKTH